MIRLYLETRFGPSPPWLAQPPHFAGSGIDALVLQHNEAIGSRKKASDALQRATKTNRTHFTSCSRPLRWRRYGGQAAFPDLAPQPRVWRNESSETFEPPLQTRTSTVNHGTSQHVARKTVTDYACPKGASLRRRAGECGEGLVGNRRLFVQLAHGPLQTFQRQRKHATTKNIVDDLDRLPIIPEPLRLGIEPDGTRIFIQ